MPAVPRSALLLALLLLCPAGTARGYGLFTCVGQDGRAVCSIDTGTRTGFSPSALCNASCPACAGRCDATRRPASDTGRWQKKWQGTPGISEGNILVPGADPGEDARSMVREGLAGPETPPTGPPQDSRTRP